MRITTDIAIRIVFLILGGIVGYIAGFSLVFSWLVIKGFVLGYGDSGPDWVGRVTIYLEVIAFVVCIFMSQVCFMRYKKNSESKN